MIKRLDRLILIEIIGPWLFGVAIFTVLIMAGSFLFELTRYLSQGISFATMSQLTVLLLPGILAKTFPMAVLLATLLGFGRLSGDSELVALRAAGASVPRIIAPVAVFGFMVSALAFSFNEAVVPWATRQAVSLREEIKTALEGRQNQPTSYPIFEDGRLVALLTAQNFSLADRTLDRAFILWFGVDGKMSFFLEADRLKYNGLRDWSVQGSATLVSADGTTRATFQDAYPPGISSPEISPEDLIAQTLRDNDALSMREIAQQRDNLRAIPTADPAQIANLDFGFWNKIAVPLTALVFGIVGAALGIRNHRTNAATGFWMSVIIIFGYMMLANLLSIYAHSGQIPAWVASFTPIGIGLVVGAWLVHAKNT